MSDSKEVVNIRVDVEGMDEAEKEAKDIDSSLKNVDTKLKKVDSSAKRIAETFKKINAGLKTANTLVTSMEKSFALSTQRVTTLTASVTRLTAGLKAANAQAAMLAQSLAAGAVAPAVVPPVARRARRAAPVAAAAAATSAAFGAPAHIPRNINLISRAHYSRPVARVRRSTVQDVLNNQSRLRRLGIHDDRGVFAAEAAAGGYRAPRRRLGEYVRPRIERDPLVPYGGVVPYRGRARARSGMGGGRVIDAEWEDMTPRGYLRAARTRALNPMMTNWFGGNEGAGIHGGMTTMTRPPRTSRMYRANIIKGKHISRAKGYLGGASPSPMTLGPPGVRQWLRSRYQGWKDKRALAAEGGGRGKGGEGFSKVSKEASLADKNIHRADKAIAKFHRSLSLFLRTVATAGVLGFGAYFAAQAADSYTVLQNKLRTVTTSEEQLNTVTERVIDLALETRSPVQEVATAFRRFDLAVQDSGGSQAESLKITEAVTKGMKAAGATAAETSQGLIQLSQAFNKGKLDGDELRSVSENMPPVFYGLAKSLGVTRGDLYRMGRTGELTGEILRKSILENLPAIREEFKKLKVPIGDAFLNIRTATLRLFGTWDKFHGHTDKISKFFLNLAKDAGLLATSLGSVATAFATLISAGAVQGVIGLFARMAATPLVSTLSTLAFVAGAGLPWIIRYSDHLKLLEKGLYLSADATEAQKKAFRKLADESDVLAGSFQGVANDKQRSALEQRKITIDAVKVSTTSYSTEQERLNKVMAKTPSQELLSFLATLKGGLVLVTSELEYQLQFWKVYAKILAGVAGGAFAGRWLGPKGSTIGALGGGAIAAGQAVWSHDEPFKSREYFQKKAVERVNAITKMFSQGEPEKGELRPEGPPRATSKEKTPKMLENFRKNYALLVEMQDKVDAKFGLQTAEQLESQSKTLEFRKKNIHYLDKEQAVIEKLKEGFQKRVDDERLIEDIAKKREKIDTKILAINADQIGGLRTEKQRYQDIENVLSDINEFELLGVSYAKHKVLLLRKEKELLSEKLVRQKAVEDAQTGGSRAGRISSLQAEQSKLTDALRGGEVHDREKPDTLARLQEINDALMLESTSFLDQFTVRFKEVWSSIGDHISSTLTDVFGTLITYGSKSKDIVNALQGAFQSLAKEVAGSFLKSMVASITKTIEKQNESVAAQKMSETIMKGAPASISKVAGSEAVAAAKKTASIKVQGAAAATAAVPSAAVDPSAIPRALAMMAILGLGSYGLSKISAGMGGDDSADIAKRAKEAARKSKEAVKDAKIASLERQLESRRLASGTRSPLGLSDKYKQQHINIIKESQALQASAGVLSQAGVSLPTDIISETGYSARVSPGGGVPSLPSQLGLPLLGNAPQVNIVNMVVSSDTEMENYLNSDMGQDTIVNVIKRNASDIRDEIT